MAERAAAVVFDLDGTLIDSAPDLHRAANAMLGQLGRPMLDLAEVRSFIGNGIPTLVARCLAATGGPVADADATAIFNAEYAASPTALTLPYPGVLSALQALRHGGHPLGICTNKPGEMARRVLADLGLAPFFDAVVGGGDAPALKPDPSALRAALAPLGAARALFVGDSEVDAATAAAAGLPFALFTAGYRKEPVAAFDADLVFDDFSVLVAHVQADAPGSATSVTPP
ncbi:MAG: phosphoglycolate phosphatase [Pseudomonadota bacterium]